MSDNTIERIRSDYPGNMLMKGWKLACKFYTETVGTMEFRLDKFHADLVTIGKTHAVSFDEFMTQT